MKEEGLLLRCILGVLFKGLLQGNSPHPTIAEQNVQRPEQRRPPAPVRLSSAVGPNAAHTADAGDQDPQPPGASAAAVIPGGGPSTAPASAPAAGQGGVWCVSVGRRSQGTVSGSHCAASFQFRPYGCKSHYRNGAGNACASRQGALSSVFAVDCRRRGRKGRGRRRRTLPGQKGLRRQRGPLRPGGGGLRRVPRKEWQRWFVSPSKCLLPTVCWMVAVWNFAMRKAEMWGGVCPPFPDGFCWHFPFKSIIMVRAEGPLGHHVSDD